MGDFNQWRTNPTVNRETKRGGGEYIEDLNLGASLDWGPPDSRIARGAHEEERRREDRNEERMRKKTCDRIVMQTRMPTSLATYKSLRALG
jgi:hypothetical protein